MLSEPQGQLEFNPYICRKHGFRVNNNGVTPQVVKTEKPPKVTLKT